MPRVRATPLPEGALLERHAASGAYTDCYAVVVASSLSLEDFVVAFYTTPLFRIERRVLALVLRRPSTDDELLRLARGEASRFAAWHVEARSVDQLLLAAGRTRSWLRVAPAPSPVAPTATTLFFGSAVVPREGGGLGGTFAVLLGFHRLYSRALLAAAARRAVRRPA